MRSLEPRSNPARPALPEGSRRVAELRQLLSSLPSSFPPCLTVWGCPGGAAHRRGSHRPQGQRGAAAPPGLDLPPGLPHPLRACTPTPRGARPRWEAGERLRCRALCAPATPCPGPGAELPPAGLGGERLGPAAAALAPDRPSPTAFPFPAAPRHSRPDLGLWLHRARSSASASRVENTQGRGRIEVSPAPARLGPLRGDSSSSFCLEEVSSRGVETHTALARSCQ